MALLEVRSLTIALKERREFLTAVNNISFKIEPGEILGLAGESGSGKTLTALSISGLLSDNKIILNGEILFKPEEKGESISLTKLGEKELCHVRGKDISIIFQEARQCLNPLMKAGRQITETLKLHGHSDKKERYALALDMLSKLGFSDPEIIYNKYPHQLSGGMCQRVMIAIAAICRPRLLIADEPTTALDEANQQQILSLLLEINRRFGTAILFISHDLSLMRKFCSRLLIMYSGRIVEEGTAEKIFNTPFHPYTRGLIGAIPDREQRGRPLANVPGKIPSIRDIFPCCPFVPRCPGVLPPCIAEFPPAIDLSGTHKVRCFSANFTAQPVQGGFNA
ncbi:MAG: ABC transporter ATP-binding protein [Treponema sp.]|nr:ABC transporter ATP-binding protein [Treponema sp.]